MAYKKQKQYRKSGYDYSQNGAYHITIVTKNRQHFFGEITNQAMQLSLIGDYVKENFNTIDRKVKYLTVTERTIMPDHLHLIIIIHNARNKDSTPAKGNLRPLQSGSVSAFVNQLKGAVKKWCDQNNCKDFQWQDKFHDRIIRSQQEYDRIAAYIRNNVLNWKS